MSKEINQEIISRHDNGNKKIVIKYIGKGLDKKIDQIITFSYNDKIVSIEKPSNKELIKYDGKEKIIIKYLGYGVDEKVEVITTYSDKQKILKIEKPIEGTLMENEYWWFNNNISNTKYFKNDKLLKNLIFFEMVR